MPLCHVIWILTNLKWNVAQFAIFVIIAICQDALFRHLFVNFCQTFDNFLPNSPSLQNWHSPKNRQLSTCPFLSSHLNIWPNPWRFLWHTRHICRNLPFLNIPLFVTSNEVLPDRWWILAQFPIFSNLPFLYKSPTVNMPVLLFHCLSPCQIPGFAKYVIFLKPTIIDIPLLSSCFNFC